MAIYEQFEQDWQKNPENGYLLGRELVDLSRTYLEIEDLGRSAEFLDQVKTALDHGNKVLEGLCERFTDVADYRFELGNAHYGRAMLADERKQAVEVLPALLLAIANHSRAIDIDAERVDEWSGSLLDDLEFLSKLSVSEAEANTLPGLDRLTDSIKPEDQGKASVYVAVILAHHQPDRAMATLAQAVRKRVLQDRGLLGDPGLDPLRGDQRFQESKTCSPPSRRQPRRMPALPGRSTRPGSSHHDRPGVASRGSTFFSQFAIRRGGTEHDSTRFRRLRRDDVDAGVSMSVDSEPNRADAEQAESSTGSLTSCYIFFSLAEFCGD